MRYSLFALCFVACCSPSFADDPIKVELDRAKANFDEQVKMYRSAVSTWFDKREEAARRDGNKKLVDQIKAERTEFAEHDKLPLNATADLRRKRTSATIAMESAYLWAVKAYVREGKDEHAEATSKELDNFKAEAALAKKPERASDSTNRVAKAIRERLANTTWKWPNAHPGHPEMCWFKLNADGTALAGWHDKPCVWSVAEDGKLTMTLAGSREIDTARLDSDGPKIILDRGVVCELLPVAAK